MWKRALSFALLLTASAMAQVTPHFECLWWNEAQMARFDPNHPPAKKTRVTLKAWEYTDPVGVPHPDVVELVTGMAQPERVTIEWLEGLQGKRTAARWTTPVAIATPGERVPIDIAVRMKALEQTGRWPFALRVTVFAKGAAPVKVELPIRPGD